MRSTQQIREAWGAPCRPRLATFVYWTGVAIPVDSRVIESLRALDSTFRAWNYKPKGGQTFGYACLAGETLVMTPQGDVPIAELAGTTARLLTRQPIGHGARASWVDAPICSYGQQSLMRVVLSRCGKLREVFATPDHRWIVEYQKGGGHPGYSAYEKTTAELKPGQRLASCWSHSVARVTRPSPVGVAHGLVTGDGTVQMRRDQGEGRIALYGRKNWPLLRFFPAEQTQGYYHDPNHTEGHILVRGLPAAWKKPPSLSEGPSYLYGWLAGYFAADGRIGKGGSPVSIASVDRDLLEHAEAVCRSLGIVTFGIHVERKSSDEPIMIAGNSADASRALYCLTIDPRSLSEGFFVIPEHAERWVGNSMKRPPSWKVESIENTDRFEEVFCAEVPKTECFALSDYLLTGNCRAIAGTSRYSLHAYGIATDVNSLSNPMTFRLVTDMPRDMVEAVLAVRTLGGHLVWGWGGYFTGDKDAMHFQVCASPPELATGINWATVRRPGGSSTSTGGTSVASRFPNVVGSTPHPNGGYWLYASDGGVMALNGAPFHGSMGGQPLNAPIVDLVSTPDGGGYWLVGADGGLFAFGNAKGIAGYGPLAEEWRAGQRAVVGAHIVAGNLTLVVDTTDVADDRGYAFPIV